MPDAGISTPSVARTLAAINLNLRLLGAIARTGVQFLLHEIRDPLRSIVPRDMAVDAFARALDDRDVAGLRNVGRRGHDGESDRLKEGAIVLGRNRVSRAVHASRFKGNPDVFGADALAERRQRSAVKGCDELVPIEGHGPSRRNFGPQSYIALGKKRRRASRAAHTARPRRIVARQKSYARAPNRIYHPRALLTEGRQPVTFG